MDTTNAMEGVDEEPTKRLLASCSFMNGIYGDSQVIPRVGYEYQAEIPPLVEEYRSLEVVKESLDSKGIMNVPNPFPMGLPIPICWTMTEVERLNGSFEFENSEDSHHMLCHGCAEYKVESPYSAVGDQKDKGGYLKLRPTTRTKMDAAALLFPQEPNSKFNQVDRCSYPLPDSSSEVWKDMERDGFLLGLYIFGKNLILVKDFVGSKAMGELLSFYYGKFYRSDGYRRWSECRKLSSRRFVHGQKLFTGWRQQELLSRLFSHISKECQDMLLEASKTFGEGKVSFEEYVFTIKNTVGLGVLVEAIGIGKGKQDLTGNAMEAVKANHVVSHRPDISIGKACSALTSADIIKFLTGDFRLSKTRTSDLFWEAVWPRLLARGWHSEQPKCRVLSGSNNSLVFIIPGVKKFSRRLVKGNHYFDSVRDVLNKIASEPGLIELEIEVPEGSIENKENKCDPAIKQAPDFMTNKHNQYLKPRNSGCSQDVMKFTIIDTSLVQGDELSRVREVRTLPHEATNISSDSEKDTSDDSDNEAQENSASNATEAMVGDGECLDLSDCVNSNSNIVIPQTSEPSFISVGNHESRDTSLLDDDAERVMNFRQKASSSDSKYIEPLIRQRNSTDCVNGESSCTLGNIASDRMLNEENSHCSFNQPDACEDLVFQTGSENLSPATSLSKGGPDEGKEGTVDGNCLHIEESLTKTRSHTVINLNVPQVSIGFESNCPLVTETLQNSDNSRPNVLFSQSEKMVQPEPLKVLYKGAEINQDPAMHNRRQSTRNRPLTTKALEALECGFFSPIKKRKAEGAPQNNSPSVRFKLRTRESSE